MITLLIMRHGEAAMTIPDDARELTPRGKQQVKQQANQLLQQPLMPCQIVASPLVRAQQTASIVAQTLSSNIPVNTLASLSPDAEPHSLLKDLDNIPVQSGCLLLVSHLPLVDLLTSYLIEGHLQRSFTFMTADVVELTTEVVAAGCCDFVKRYRV